MGVLKFLGDVLFLKLIIFTLYHFVLDVRLKLYWVFTSFFKMVEEHSSTKLLTIPIPSVSPQQSLRVYR